MRSLSKSTRQGSRGERTSASPGMAKSQAVISTLIIFTAPSVALAREKRAGEENRSDFSVSPATAAAALRRPTVKNAQNAYKITLERDVLEFIAPLLYMCTARMIHGRCECVTKIRIRVTLSTDPLVAMVILSN